MSARAAAAYHQYAPLGQFRPWALLRLPDTLSPNPFRLAYPTLICASYEYTFLYDVRTGSLEQKFNLRLRRPFENALDVDSGNEVLRIPVDATAWCSQSVYDTFSIAGDRLITPIPVHPKADFERICRGETTLEQAALVLDLPNGLCLHLAFKHGRVCVANMHGHFIFTFGSDLSVKAMSLGWTGSVELTDCRIYFMLDERRRRDIPLFEDNKSEVSNCPQSPVLVNRRAGFKISFVVTSN
ncbi:hypothetical protein EI94DRAFT_1723016, partial [Lactarius quietus]